MTLGILSGLLNLAGTGLYIYEVLKKRAIPERATWGIWTMLGVVAFLSQKSIGAHNSLWFVALQTVGVTIVFSMSLKYGVGGLTKNDLFITGVALLGILLWILTSQPLVALVMVVLTRGIAVSATIRKAYKEPKSEAALPWFIYACSAVLAFLSVGSRQFELLLYPTYLILADSAVMLAKYHTSLQVSRVAQEISNHSHLATETQTYHEE